MGRDGAKIWPGNYHPVDCKRLLYICFESWGKEGNQVRVPTNTTTIYKKPEIICQDTVIFVVLLLLTSISKMAKGYGFDRIWESV
jgi:hypothetical protein